MDRTISKELRKLGLHIKSLRVKRDYSQEELAAEADISISQIGRIERGELNPSFRVLLSIARALEIPLSKVVDYDS